MTRTWKLFIVLLAFFASSAIVSAQAPPLGDVARKEKTKPKPQAARIYTNEDIPSIEPSKNDKAAATANSDLAASTAEGAAADKSAAKPEAKSPVESQKELNSEWKRKVEDQKAKVGNLQREIDLMQREQRLKSAVFYSDAGNKLRDNKQWLDDEQKFQADLTTRQKELAEAKTKLEDTREAARKAGATGYE